jgi:hypothetical protein
VDKQLGLFNPLNAEAVQLGIEKGGATVRDRQLGIFNPLNAQALQQAKGGAAGKGVKKPRMTAAQKARLPQGLCSGGCGKSGVVGKQHNKPRADTGGRAVKCGVYQASE